MGLDLNYAGDNKVTLQDKLYILFEEPGKSKASYILNVFIYILILISIINLMLITVPEYQEKYGDIFLTTPIHIISATPHAT